MLFRRSQYLPLLALGGLILRCMMHVSSSYAVEPNRIESIQSEVVQDKNSSVRSAKLNSIQIDSNQVKAAINFVVASQSRITFRVYLFGVVPIEGTIKLSDATARMEQDQFLVSVEADSNSVKMSDRRRTRWAQSSEFFDAKNHPKIFFKAAPIKRSVLLKGGLIEGEVSLRGITKPIKFNLDPSPCIDQLEARDCEIIAHTSVARGEFGMNSRKLVLGDKVRLDLTMVLTRADSNSNSEPRS